MEKNSILVIDDDRNILAIIEMYLRKAGYEVTCGERGDEALQAFRRAQPALVVLDVMLPGMDGWEVLDKLRQESDVPVIMLTAKGDTLDRIQGLDLGADDYIAKPFNPRELLARIHAVLRRRPAKDQPGAPSKENIVVRFGDFELDLGRRELRKNGELIALTTGEFAVMKAFARHPKVPLSRDKLMEMARGREYEAFDRSLDVQVSRLRKLIEPDPAKPRYLQTVWGLGYVFIPDDTASGKDGVKPETK